MPLLTPFRTKINLGFKFFFFFGWAQSLNGARGGGSRPWEKNPLSKRAKSGPQVLACGSGPGIEKPGPNLTRCHSYRQLGNDIRMPLVLCLIYSHFHIDSLLYQNTSSMPLVLCLIYSHSRILLYHFLPL